MTNISPKVLEEKSRIVREALEQGERSIKTLCNLAGYEPATFRVLFKKGHIHLPEDIIPYRFWPELDRLIERSASLCEMGASVHKYIEGARQYIEASGQYYLWKKGREEKRAEEAAKRKEEKASLAKRVANLYAIALEASMEGGEAYRKTAEACLFMSKVHHRFYFEDLVIFFENKERAEREGRRAALHELVEGTTIYPSFASKVLRYVGDEPLGGARERHTVTEYQRECIERAFSLEMPVPDIAHLIGGVKAPVVSRRFDLMEESGGARKKARQSYNGFPRGDNYRTASRVYRLMDRGYSAQGIVRRLGKPLGVVDYDMQHRLEIEPVIMGALKRIHPTRDVTRPYRTWR